MLQMNARYTSALLPIPNKFLFCLFNFFIFLSAFSKTTLLQLGVSHKHIWLQTY